MDEFAKSRDGKKLLENDLPKLMSLIERLTEQLVESNKIQNKKLVLEQKRFN